MSSPQSSLKKAFKTIVLPRIRIVITGLLLIIVSKSASFVAPMAMRTFIDDLIPNEDLLGIKNLVALVLVALVIQAVTSFMLIKLVSVQAQYLITELRAEVQRKVLSLPVRFFDNTQSGALVSRVMKDVEGVKSLVGTGLVQLIGGLFTAVVAFVLLIRISPTLTLFSLAPLALFAVVAIKAFSVVRPVFRERGKIEAEVKGRLTETLSGIRIVKGFHAEKSEEASFSKGIHRLFDNVKKSMIYMALVSSSSILLAGIATTVITGIGGYYIINDQLTLGAFLQFTFLLGLLISPIFQLTSVGTEITDALAGLDRTEELLSEVSEYDDSGKTPFTEPLRSLRFDKVSYAYEKENLVLKNIDLEVKRGEVVALVGTSGAGKSTLASLAASYLTPTQGTVWVNDQPLGELSLSDYRSKLGVVLQDDFLFDGTLKENLLFVKPEASDQELEKALSAAHVKEFTDQFERGIDTIIGERGVKLSGGQRQRLAIARALLADPELLILDEATSSLDTESESLIQQSLAELTRGRATLVIAHRLSTIRNANLIVVLEKGQIVERGSHEELFQKQGRYYDLYTRQAKI
ncbi:MAG: ABC transporter ATP-binding protein [Bacteroidetes bacterium]|nr:ABC transporter ATP-binding protein [Bacteroidota bacterium]MDA0950443.1 ABC transporter ATP-binding protein [Bacteroidota bacterium]